MSRLGGGNKNKNPKLSKTHGWAGEIRKMIIKKEYLFHNHELGGGGLETGRTLVLGETLPQRNIWRMKRGGGSGMAGGEEQQTSVGPQFLHIGT